MRKGGKNPSQDYQETQLRGQKGKRQRFEYKLLTPNNMELLNNSAFSLNQQSDVSLMKRISCENSPVSKKMVILGTKKEKTDGSMKKLPKYIVPQSIINNQSPKGTTAYNRNAAGKIVSISNNADLSIL